ncbi:MAG: hypothetical protein FVQ83_07970 [Chloroflexi bacterium]|nr:hypothetical protein [Chloroflexota bacterium]
MKPKKGFIVGIICVTVLTGMRIISPERSIEYTGPRALLDAGFALGLLLFILSLAAGIGLKILRWFKLQGLTHLERILFSLAIGLGVVAYGVLALGLVGLLKKELILLWLGIATLWSWKEWGGIISLMPRWTKKQIDIFRNLGIYEKGFIVLTGLIVGLSAVQALSPPWDYDGLMYHLQVPRLFLEAERIILLPDVLQANSPLTTEMLYSIGLGFGSDVFAKLIHLAFMGLLLFTTFSLGGRLFSGAGGWVASAIILGIPIFPIWGGLAYADMAWAFFELLAIYSFILWMEKNQVHFLALSGVFTGLAMGSKYFALGLLGVLGLFTLWLNRKEGGRKVIRYGFMYTVPALLVALPWYVKNWVLGGNPLYPLFFGGVAWPEERLDLLLLFTIDSFGVGRSLIDYLKLPWDIYANHVRFGTFITSIEYPSFLFPLVLLFPLISKNKALKILAGITLLRFIVWSIGSQQTRFLLPLFAPLSILVAGVLIWLGSRIKFDLLRRVLGNSLLAGFVMMSLVYQVLFISETSPLAPVLGMESKVSFLRREVYDYQAVEYISEYLKPSDRVLMMWDGQGYYCDERCLPDAEQSQWVQLVINSAFDVEQLAGELRSMSVTHLLFSLEGANFFLNHDPGGWHKLSIEFFIQEFKPFCTQEIYLDDAVALYEIICN